MPIGKGTSAEAFIDNLQQVGELAAGDPNSWSPSEGIIGNVVRTACNGWSTSPTSNVPFGASNNFMRELCNPYFQASGYQAPSDQPDYTGGQCPALYVVTVNCTATVRNLNTNQTFTNVYAPSSTGNLQGPLGSTNVQVINVPINSQTIVVTIQTATGVVTLAQFSLQNDRAFVDRQVSFSVARQDGQPDVCGNPQPPYRPGTAPVYVYGTPATFTRGNTSFTYVVNPPQITPDRGIEWIVEFPEFDIDLFGGSSPGGDGVGGGDDGVPGAGEPFGPDVPVGQDGAEGDAGGRELRGLHVRIPNVPETPRVEFGSPNELYYNLGWVAFGNEVSFGSFERIIADDQWFDAPDDATRYRVKLNPFVEAVVKVYVEPED